MLIKNCAVNNLYIFEVYFLFVSSIDLAARSNAFPYSTVFSIESMPKAVMYIEDKLYKLLRLTTAS